MGRRHESSGKYRGSSGLPRNSRYHLRDDVPKFAEHKPHALIYTPLFLDIGWLRLVHVSVSNETPSVVQIAFEETRDVHRDETVRQTKTPSHTLTRLPPWCTHPRGQVVGDLLQSPECDYHVYSPEQMQDAFASSKRFNTPARLTTLP